MKKLHEKQERILELLKENKENPLTIGQLMGEVKIDSPGVFYYHLNQLQKKGFLKYNPNNSRDYIVLDKPEDSIVYIPKYGMAQCGPEGLILDSNIEDQIPIASKLFRFATQDAFIVEAKGDSMEPKIVEGDIIIAKRQTSAENGDIIVCSYNSAAMIKVFSSVNGMISLNSLKFHKYNPIMVGKDDEFHVAGVVKHILRLDIFSA